MSVAIEMKRLTHERCTVFSCEINVDALCEVGNLGCDHVGGQVGEKLLATVLAPEASRVLCHLASAVLAHARRVKDPVVVLNARHVAVQEEKVVLIRVVLVAETFIDLADEVEIAIPGWFVTIMAHVLPGAIVAVARLVLIGAAVLATFCLIRLLRQARDAGEGLFAAARDEVFVPELQRAALLMVHVDEEH